ncbi:MAG: hypothetical protein FJZ09_07270, partial [Candidatus Omnitrophica bacterium]|nr:hypothetical protein [Candidatus Omnitrophota bacterium]
FSLVDEKKARFLVDAEVDMLTVSIWAGTAKAYMRTHPNKTEEDFYRIRENLKRLSGLKMKSTYNLPKVKIYNVICNQNYQEISAMVDLAIEVGAEFVEFQIMDIIEGQTSSLALTKGQVEEVKGQLERLNDHKDLHFKVVNSFSSQAEKELREFSGWFCKIPGGFQLKETMKKGDDGQVFATYSLVCPKGQETRPSCDNPLIEEDKNRVTFSFQKETCSVCPLFGPGCLVDVHGGSALNLTRIASFGTFLRRLSSENVYKQIYEEKLINDLPCYVGWTYSRILSTGEVIPCCKSSNKIIGNITKRKLLFLKRGFADIWNSGAYQKFRHSAKSLLKSHAYFKKINCFKSCDNVGMNLQTKELMLGVNANTEAASMKGQEGRYALPVSASKILIHAEHFKSGNLNSHRHNFGSGMVIDGGKGFAFAEYDVELPESGEYQLWSYYASGKRRPVNLYFDGRLILEGGLHCNTGGWSSRFLRWFKETPLFAEKGRHALKLESKGFIPHLYSFALLLGVQNLPASATKVLIPAAHFKSGNLNLREHNFGSGMVIDGGKGFAFAEYDVELPESGEYQLWTYYASAQPRPVNLYFDG